MIVLLGPTGYVGQAFLRRLQEKGDTFIALSRQDVDYSRYDVLVDFLSKERPQFLINAAGYTGKPNVDHCEIEKADTIQGNLLLPVTIAHACQATGTPWGHVSSGCIYVGAKITVNGTPKSVKDLHCPEVQELLQHRRDKIQGWSEDDPPNFSFRDAPCSFYSGTKAMAEEFLIEQPAYLWRLRIPFNEVDNPRNYLTKLLRYPKVYDNVNSLSHLDDYVDACLQLWRLKAPFGAYNVTNEGFVTTREVIEMIQDHLALDRTFEFWLDDDEFYNTAAKALRSNCVMDVSKLRSVGVEMRPVVDALTDALTHWKTESSVVEC